MKRLAILGLLIVANISSGAGLVNGTLSPVIGGGGGTTTNDVVNIGNTNWVKINHGVSTNQTAVNFTGGTGSDAANKINGVPPGVTIGNLTPDITDMEIDDNGDFVDDLPFGEITFYGAVHPTWTGPLVLLNGISGTPFYTNTLMDDFLPESHPVFIVKPDHTVIAYSDTSHTFKDYWKHTVGDTNIYPLDGLSIGGIINSGTNTAVFHCITNPITTGQFYTNLTTARTTLYVNYTLNDSAVSGFPSLMMTNISSGQWFVATNDFALSTHVPGQVVFDMSPSDYFIATNKSSLNASTTINGSFLLIK